MGRTERRMRREADKAEEKAEAEKRNLHRPATVGEVVHAIRDHNWRHHTPWWRKLWLRFKASRAT